MVGALNYHRFSSSGSIWLAQLHFHTFDTCYNAVFIALDFNRVCKKLEDNTFFHSVMNLFCSCRKLIHTATVDDIYFACTHSLGTAGSVHSNVTAAYDGDLVSVHDRSIVFRLVCLHQVDTGQVLVC